jgi:hypothetical protein
LDVSEWVRGEPTHSGTKPNASFIEAFSFLRATASTCSSLGATIVFWIVVRHSRQCDFSPLRKKEDSMDKLSPLWLNRDTKLVLHNAT